MFGPSSHLLPFVLAARYLTAGSRNRFAAFVGLFSTLGVTLGVAALVAILSVMNGFEQQLYQHMLSRLPHATLTQDTQLISNWQATTAHLKSLPSTLDVSPIIATQAVIQSDAGLEPLYLDGIEPQHYPVERVQQRFLLEQLKPGQFSIILDQSYQRLGLRLGDKVRVILPGRARFTPLGKIPTQRQFTVIGFVEQRFSAHELGAFIHRLDAARLLYQPLDFVNQIRVWVKDPMHVATFTQSQPLEEGTWQDWRTQNSDLFRAIRTEKIMTTTMLVLIVTVALFNILSAMVMQIFSKESDIAILKTLGMRSSGVLAIFLIQGAAHGVLGSVLGVTTGIFLSLHINSVLGFLGINFYFSSGGQALPIVLNEQQIVMISVVAITASVLATVYPAWFAAKIKPAQALKYE